MAIALQPDNFDAWFLKGDAWTELGNTAEAQTAYTKAGLSKPYYPPLFDL
jgi:Flp pilus assembly protein TadD